MSRTLLLAAFFLLAPDAVFLGQNVQASAPAPSPVATPGTTPGTAPDSAPDPVVQGLGPAAPARSERPAFVFLPNGAGRTPQEALTDLDRIMAAYEKKPGFIRYPYYKIVAISKNQYQADGMCTWDSPDAKHAADPRKK